MLKGVGSDGQGARIELRMAKEETGSADEAARQFNQIGGQERLLTLSLLTW